MRRMAQTETFASAHGQKQPCIAHAHQCCGFRRLRAPQKITTQISKTWQGRKVRCTTGALEEADWEEEMSLFRKRLQKPNQLETMRKIVEEVDLGKVGTIHAPPDNTFPITAARCK